MDHSFILNTYSLPASSQSVAYDLFYDSAKGLLAIRSNMDRCVIYYDGDSLQDSTLAESYTFKDFIRELGQKGEADLQLFLLEAGDKMPALEHLSDEDFDEVSNCAFYFPDDGYTGSVDIIGLSWFLDATLWSIPTSERWNSVFVKVARYDQSTHEPDFLELRNISKKEHGEQLKLLFEDLAVADFNDIIENCRFTAEFKEWAEQLNVGNKKRLSEKLALASRKNFEGGEPMFKTLEDGFREIRFSAYDGGAIRVLFKRIDHDYWAILVGFIKKNNTEGYDAAIPKAKQLFTSL